MREQAISARTKLACILGRPVSHSLSPAMHNAAFEAMNLDWIYLAFDVAPIDLEKAVFGLRALGASGANVTMPHKQSVLQYLDEISDDARLVNAVNTIVSREGSLRGENTDGAGFVQFLTADVHAKLEGSTVLLLGAGGSARAIAMALARENANVVISARRIEQASEAAELSHGSTVDWQQRAEAARSADLIVNATPLNDDSPIDEFNESQIVIDLIYVPAQTALLETARNSGAKVFNGLGMLLHQAMLSFELWTGLKAPETVLRTVIDAQL